MDLSWQSAGSPVQSTHDVASGASAKRDSAGHSLIISKWSQARRGPGGSLQSTRRYRHWADRRPTERTQVVAINLTASFRVRSLLKNTALTNWQAADKSKSSAFVSWWLGINTKHVLPNRRPMACAWFCSRTSVLSTWSWSPRSSSVRRSLEIQKTLPSLLCRCGRTCPEVTSDATLPYELRRPPRRRRLGQ